jgi:hypothetical protein
MTTYSGPENYRMSHELLDLAEKAHADGDLAEASILAMLADTRARLAHAAATALASTIDSHRRWKEDEAWLTVAASE